jgi:hypothetical protein
MADDLDVPNQTEWNHSSICGRIDAIFVLQLGSCDAMKIHGSVGEKRIVGSAESLQ